MVLCIRISDSELELALLPLQPKNIRLLNTVQENVHVAGTLYSESNLIWYNKYLTYSCSQGHLYLGWYSAAPTNPQHLDRFDGSSRALLLNWFHYLCFGLPRDNLSLPSEFPSTVFLSTHPFPFLVHAQSIGVFSI